MEKSFKIYHERDLLVIEALLDRFDFFEISKSAAYLRGELQRNGFPSIIFDLSSVRYIDSSVFGFFIETRNMMLKNSREIVLVCDRSDILHIMKMLMLPQIIKIFSTREKAAVYLSGNTRNFNDG